VRDIPLDLDGFEVVALNATKLRSDNIDPRDTMQRLEDWKVRVAASGGRWAVIKPPRPGVSGVGVSLRRPARSRVKRAGPRRSGHQHTCFGFGKGSFYNIPSHRCDRAWSA
jgi:hypothetical protein